MRFLKEDLRILCMGQDRRLKVRYGTSPRHPHFELQDAVLCNNIGFLTAVNRPGIIRQVPENIADTLNVKLLPENISRMG